jgi:D-beta-D-heptose 7-phosphate kinase/D-beta-D-heptose 1-phosphate adenosyltransferase
VTYLNQAKAMGHVLIVGVNTDESVRRRKGPQRPINTLEDRLQVLAGVSSVDYVVPFGEDTPAELLAILKPDVFVKGGDYTRETLPEAAVVESYGGVVHILPYVENRSTTYMIQRIREVYAGPDGRTESAAPQTDALTLAEAPAGLVAAKAGHKNGKRS